MVLVIHRPCLSSVCSSSQVAQEIEDDSCSAGPSSPGGRARRSRPTGVHEEVYGRQSLQPSCATAGFPSLVT
ncbi:hypothetical protein VPH35_131827 [Triticum aestivum]